MNSLYIGVGVAIILALVAALIGPLFIDWTAYKATFEREGARIVGHPVTVMGAVDARLLPIPSLSFGDVVIGDVNRPLLKIGRIDLKAEVTPLLKGDVRISELKLDRPVLDVRLEADGRLTWLGSGRSSDEPARDMSGISIDKAEIVDGGMLVTDKRNGGVVAIDGINAIASATSLNGPYKAEGGADYGGRAYSFRLATVKPGEDLATGVKLHVEEADGQHMLDLDSSLAMAGNLPKLTGSVILQLPAKVAVKGAEGEAGPLPWRAEGKFGLDAGRLLFETLSLSVGPDERAFAVTGAASATFGAKPSFEAVLSAKQIDLDRVLVAKVGDAAPIDDALGRFMGWLADLPEPGMPGHLGVNLPGVVFGGGVIQDVNLDARTRAGGWTIEQLEARLPGRTRILLVGKLAAHAPTLFDGHVSLNSEQPNSFAQWWRRGRDAARLEPFSIETAIKVGANQVHLDELTAKLGGSVARGWLEWLRPTPNGPDKPEEPTLRTGLTADQIDFDQVRAVAGLFAAPEAGATRAGTFGLGAARVDLDAGSVVLGGATAQRVKAGIGFEGEAIVIDALSIGDLAGAALEAKGRIANAWTAPDGSVDATIKAERLDGAVKALTALTGDTSWMRRLAAAAPYLGPASLKGRLDGKAGQSSSDIKLTVDGMAADSRVSLDGRFTGNLGQWRDGAIVLKAAVQGPDAGRVLRQVGVAASSIKASAGAISIEVVGSSAKGLDLTVAADVAGTGGSVQGKLRMAGDAPASFDGQGRIVAKDIVPLALLLGQQVPGMASALPVDIAGGIAGSWPKLALNPLQGLAAGAAFTGSGTVDFSEAPVRVGGKLDIAALDLPTVIELGLGADTVAGLASVAAGQVWSAAPLPGPVLPMLVADIALKVESFGLDATHSLKNASARLHLRPTEVALETLEGEIAGGAVLGDMVIRRAVTGETTVSGEIRLSKLGLETLAWRQNGKAVATGTLDATSTFETSGRSVSGLVAGLSGGGTLRVTSGTLRLVNAEAFKALIQAADGGLELKDDKIRPAFQTAWDAGSVGFDRIDSAFGIGGGVVRMRDIGLDAAALKAKGSAAIDLNRWRLDSDWTVKADVGRDAVAGADAQAGIGFHGTLDAPERKLDVAPLTAFLTLRAYEREVQRVEVLQQDILERERFARELKRLGQEKARREQDSKDATDAAKRAEDDKRKAAAMAAPAGDAAPSPTVSAPNQISDFEKLVRPSIDGAGAPPLGTATASPAAAPPPGPTVPPPLPPAIKVQRPPPILAPTDPAKPAAPNPASQPMNLFPVKPAPPAAPAPPKKIPLKLPGDVSAEPVQ